MVNLKLRLESLLGKGRVKLNYDLTDLTTLRVGAKARYFFEARERGDLINVQKVSSITGLAVVIIGGGSNIVFSDRLINKLVVKNSYWHRKIINQSKEAVDVLFSSGYPLAKIVKETVNQGYGGFEYHFGLPGTLGGAIYMNSKWVKPTVYIGDNLLYAFLLNKEGKVVKKKRDYFQFKYGYSRLQDEGNLLLEAVFRLQKIKPSLLKERMGRVLNYRRQTQPTGVFSSGCFFKNISEEDKKRLKLPTLSAGYLIDKAGLKGVKRGAFVVSEKHANFIINQGGGKVADLLSLIELIKNKIYDRFTIDLVEEVELV